MKESEIPDWKRRSTGMLDYMEWRNECHQKNAAEQDISLVDFISMFEECNKENAVRWAVEERDSVDGLFKRWFAFVHKWRNEK